MPGRMDLNWACCEPASVTAARWAAMHEWPRSRCGVSVGPLPHSRSSLATSLWIAVTDRTISTGGALPGVDLLWRSNYHRGPAGRPAVCQEIE